MLKAIAIDTEPQSLETIKMYCKNSELIELENTFTSIAKATIHIHRFPVDLIIADAETIKISGTDFYKKTEQDIIMILTSSEIKYSLDAFEINAIDFLLKPFTQQRFQTAITKVIDYKNLLISSKTTTEHESIFLRVDGSLKKIITAEILYIESLADLIMIYIENQNRVTVRMTMKEILEKLDPKEFIRVHRYFIIPLSKIENVKKGIIIIAGKEIPIGKTYKENVKKYLK